MKVPVTQNSRYILKSQTGGFTKVKQQYIVVYKNKFNWVMCNTKISKVQWIALCQSRELTNIQKKIMSKENFPLNLLTSKLQHHCNHTYLTKCPCLSCYFSFSFSKSYILILSVCCLHFFFFLILLLSAIILHMYIWF